MNSVTFVGYGLAFLIAVIIAARWIYLHHPALRDSNLDPPRKSPETSRQPPARKYSTPPPVHCRATDTRPGRELWPPFVARISLARAPSGVHAVLLHATKKGTQGMATSNKLPAWTVWSPLAAWAAFGLGLLLTGQSWMIAVMAAALAGAVFSAVHHAEVVAHKVGEPFGTLVLRLP
jgi:hypothetical protein